MSSQGFEYQGENWVHTFIKAPSMIPFHEMMSMLQGAVHMYVNRHERMGVEGDAWAGEIYDTREEVTFAGVKGHLFKGEIYTFEEGRVDISFVVGKSQYADPIAHQRRMQRRQNRQMLKGLDTMN